MVMELSRAEEHEGRVVHQLDLLAESCRSLILHVCQRRIYTVSWGGGGGDHFPSLVQLAYFKPLLHDYQKS